MKLLPTLFRDGAGLLSEKVDALLAHIASILNGNLDADNLAAGLTLGSAMFEESRGLFALRMAIPTRPSGDDFRLGVLPVAARLVGWGLQSTIPMGGDYWWQPTISVLKNGAIADTVTPSLAKSSRSASGKFTGAAAFAIGDVVSVRLPSISALSPEFGSNTVVVNVVFDCSAQV